MFPISLRSKRAQLALRFFTYGVMTLATVVLTTLAIFYAMGYRFNQSSLEFEQGGLVQFRSLPEAATVVVDGVAQNFKTPGRANFPAGDHTIVMQLSGYRDWQRTVSLAPGQLLWLNYARLFPTSITTVPVKTFPSVTGMLPAPDHRWIVIQEKQDTPSFTLVDLADEKKPVLTTLTIPDAALPKKDGKIGTLSLVEWDLSSRYFIVRQQNAGVDQWLRVDRTNPNETINISDKFRLAITDIHFSGGNPNFVYVKTDDVLRKLDINANSASAALVVGVQQFSVYGDDTISYIAKRPSADGTQTQQFVGLYRGNKELVLQAFPLNATVRIAFGQYDNHDFFAIHTGDGDVRVLRNPFSENQGNAEFATFTTGKPVQWLKMSNNGRMVVAGVDDVMITYDLELGRSYRSILPFAGAANSQPLQWLDDYYLWSDSGERLRLLEFDGQNEREITTVAPGFSATLSPSGKTLFSIGKNTVTNSYFLQASQLTTPY
ncbi:MAG TPA: PEGA domain-containing protein [Candidatus Saccharimonadales bacterium]|nr:PEGA domain-containing protein [Candidatus Saccharimonadales bacterium]